MNEYVGEEFETFLTTSKSGEELEMAVIDKFEYEGKHYVVASLVVDDEVDDSNCFVYRSIKLGEEIQVSKIEDIDEYERISSYYLSLK